MIAIAAIIGIANGYQRGLWLSAAQYAGLVLGVVAGAALAPGVADVLGLTDTRVRSLAAVLVLIVGGSVGSSLGYVAAAFLRHRLAGGRGPLPPERAGGALVSGVAVLGVMWFLGLTFDRGPSPELARLIQGSSLLRTIDAAAPRPPPFLAGVERTLAGVPFPQPFAVLAPEVSPLPPPASIDTAGVNRAAAATWKVTGRGCGGLVTGSAYPIAGQYLVTNAHVVSGTTRTRVQRDDGTTLSAAVVLFDPDRDVAVLYVPSARFTVLGTAAGQRGTQGAVVGYPEGGREQESPAVIDQSLTARGRDIYNQNLVDRQIYILQAQVVPGNSGGPLVDLNGNVLGMVFAASSGNQDEAYALTDEEIAHDEQQGMQRTSGIDTSQYACAV
ncbi:MAG TPA: MarP family serine protease [Candidatus Dormibacteraeota bacterium]